MSKICEYCWAKFETANHHSNQKFCSSKCKNQYHTEKQEYKKCLWCWEYFYGTRRTKYCEKCHIKKCLYCWAEFHWRHTDKFCSHKHRDAYRLHSPIKKECEWCGEEFFWWERWTRFCSEECKLASKHKKTVGTCLEKRWVPYVILREDIQEKSWQKISVTNLAIRDTFVGMGYDVELEVAVWYYSYDFKIGDVLIEYNPTYTHSPDIKTHYKNYHISPYYHKGKVINALENWYRCINFFEWDNIEDLNALLSKEYDLGVDNYILDMSKGNYKFLLDNWYKLSSRSPSIAHNVIHRWKIVRVYDCWVATFKRKNITDDK